MWDSAFPCWSGGWSGPVLSVCADNILVVGPGHQAGPFLGFCVHKISSAGRLVESISGMLGFTRVESLVLVLVRGGVLDCLMRADLAEAMRADGPERLADLVARNSADGVVAVVVSAEGASCPMCGSQFRALVGDVSAALKRRGGQLFDAVMVDGVEAGGRWSCIDNCGVAGVLDDPATSVMAAAAVVDGRRMFGTRDELKASVAVDADRVAALAPI